MKESFNYSEHFEKCFSPAVSDVSPHPILEFYRESWRDKKSRIENPDLIDDAQSKLQSVGQTFPMENESDIISHVRDKSATLAPISKREGSEPKLQCSIKPIEEVLAPTLIRRAESFETKLLGSIEPIHKAVAPPQTIFSKEKSPIEINYETGQTSSVKHDVKEKIKGKKRQSNSVKDEVEEKNKRKKKKTSNVDGDSWLPAGWVKIERYRKTGKLVGCSYKLYREPGTNTTFRSKTQAKEYIREQKLFEDDRGNKFLKDTERGVQVGFETKLLGSVKPIHKALAPSKIIFSKEQKPLENYEEIGQPSNVKYEMKEKIKRAKRQSNSVKDEAKEKNKRKKKQSSNEDGDSWLPARWAKNNRYSKTGKLVGCSYKLYRELGTNTTFRSKTQAKEYIRELKLFEDDRGKKYLENAEQGVQEAEDIQTISINGQVVTSQSEISGTGGDVLLNANT